MPENYPMRETQIPQEPERQKAEIGKALELTPSYLSPYFKHLESLKLLERRLPATVAPAAAS